MVQMKMGSELLKVCTAPKFESCHLPFVKDLGDLYFVGKTAVGQCLRLSSTWLGTEATGSCELTPFSFCPFLHMIGHGILYRIYTSIRKAYI
jgi:hypothetical protein